MTVQEKQIPSSTPDSPSNASAPATRSEDPLSNRYRIERQLGAGTDGVSYQATELAGGGLVEFHVIDKAFRSETRQRELESRLRIVKLLEHESSHRIEELLLDQLPPAVACVNLPSRSLSSQRELDAGAAVKIAQQLCAVLAEAHRFGLFHGGLNPDAVFLTDDARVRLDFTGLRTGRPSVPVTAGTLVSDIEHLGELLKWLLIDRTIVAGNAEQLDARNLAALKQLIRTTRKTGESCEISDFQDCLERFLRESSKPESFDVKQDTLQQTEFVHDNSCEPDETVETPNVEAGASPTDATAADAFDLAVSRAPAAGRHLQPLQKGDRLGRYRIETKLGEGGMGTVYRACDLGSNRKVAIKVLHAGKLASTIAVRRFQKEARMLAKVNNPYVANLLEVNEENGRHFLAIEFVEGETVKNQIAGRQPLDERMALQIAGDIGRALIDAHEFGIVHRDIKPENVHVSGVHGEDGRLQIKLLDFGIAREIDQTESMALTQQGTMLGTPIYMSPEQCKGNGEVGPQSDIYSLGISLYEMLTGQPPFSAPDPMKLAAMHCFEAAPDIRKKNPKISEAAAEIVQKAIAKKPEDRYADAAHFVKEVDRILKGDAASVEVHPILPPHDRSKLFRLDLNWNLDSTPDRLWPYVSNTERINRAIGLPSVSYRTEQDPKVGLRKFGTFRLGGVRIEWEEHPFEWIEGRRMGVLREFEKGPFRWFMSIVELEPLPSGGTKLHHKVRIAPRNMLGSLLARLEADWKGRRSLDRVYRRIDNSLVGKIKSGIADDPFEFPSRLSNPRLHRLQQRTERLIDRGVAADVADKLCEYLASAPAQEVGKIRPVALADRLAVDQNEMVETLLFASVEGLVTLAWDILCPTCRSPADAKETLKQLEKHTYCEACDLDFQSNIANSVEMVFRVHPELRNADTGQYCIGGPEHAPHVVAQLRLEPGERLELETQLEVGEYLLRGPRLTSNVSLHVREKGAPARAEISLRPDADPRRGLSLRGGQQLLELTNEFDHLQVIRLERTLPRQDLVTAAQASALPVFRKLFPQQVLGAGQLMSAEQVTLLVTAIENVDALYAELGDAAAYSLIQQQLEIVEEVIREFEGAVVKIIGEGVEAAWHDSVNAVRAAMRLQPSLDQNSETRRIRLSIGVHRGATLVTTINDRLDYFGATARAAGSLPAQAKGGLVLTDAVYSDPAVARLIQEQYGAAPVRSANLPGAPESLMMRLETSEEIDL